ncbi:MAG: hypothetical protein FWH11_01230 [Micrococcales bacterium]|nr:hypothetical protein [Micrococcales bacterium]
MGAPKKPQDHRKKAKRPKKATPSPTHGAPVEYRITVRGMELVVTEDALDDWDVVEELNDRSGGGMPSAVRRILGPAQDAKVRALCTDEKTGRVVGSQMAEWVAEFFEALADAS